MNSIYTIKQLELMKLWQNDRLKRINLLEGSVSSGKTWISLVLWAFWVASMPKDKLYLMCGKSLTTLKRNCLLLLEEQVGVDNFKFSLSSKEAYLFDRKIMLEGANDSRSESKIRGMTLQGAYCDELTLFPHDFFKMLLSRLRVSGAKLIATTNPDTPYHWLKKDFIDRQNEIDMLDIKFLLDDNDKLPLDYVENLKKEYTGIFYERFILGLWKAAEGVIYRGFADDTESYLIDKVSDDIMFCTIGMDFGGNGSAHAMICTGSSKSMQKVIVLDEYYRKEIISPAELEKDVCRFIRRCQQKYKAYDMYCDSAEQVLIKGIKSAVMSERIPINIHNARKSAIIGRIRFFNSIMAQRRFFVMKHCSHLIEALQSAVWDSKSIKDIRLDNGEYNIDSLDALEYSAEPFMNDIIEMR